MRFYFLKSCKFVADSWLNQKLPEADASGLTVCELKVDQLEAFRTDNPNVEILTENDLANINKILNPRSIKLE